MPASAFLILNFANYGSVLNSFCLANRHQAAPTLYCLVPSPVGSKPFIIAYLLEEKC